MLAVAGTVLAVSVMRRTGLVLAVLAGAGWALPASADAKVCGRVQLSTRHAKAKVRVVRGQVGCGPAHTLIADAFTAIDRHKADGTDQLSGRFWLVDGWKCFTGLAASQLFCEQARKEVDGSTRGDDGWFF